MTTVDSHFWALLAALALSAVAAIFDHKTRCIPNWVTLPPLLVAPVVYALLWGWWALLHHVLALLICGAVPYFFFRLGAMGGGDVKLLAALGAILGIYSGVELQFVSYLVAAVYALLVLAWYGQALRTVRNAMILTVNLVLPRQKQQEIAATSLTEIRLGVPVFVATLVLIVFSFVR